MGPNKLAIYCKKVDYVHFPLRPFKVRRIGSNQITTPNRSAGWQGKVSSEKIKNKSNEMTVVIMIFQLGSHFL